MGDIYLGRGVGADLKESGGAVAFDADRLTQHAVCFGMTGSGKTGFCVTLLEELAMQRVPLIVIDPKGDMCNLALAFADHSPADFAKWVDPAEADRAGLSVEAFATQLSERWRKGLADHQVDDARIKAFVDGADVKIYTPGSKAGIPVDVLGMLRAPSAELDDETLRDLVSGTVSALLGLVDVDADPVKDPEHVLFAQIIELAWREGRDLDLEGLILALVDPPFKKIGVFPVDTFFPRNDRMKLAMTLNGVIASPSFAVWSQGQPLDIEALLKPSAAGTPVRIFTLAHLEQSERMFFASTLLNQIVAWSRRQPGSSALRALVYFDEVYGFLPPYPKNPPTKAPVLTLMKQARAVGVGTMLVTQNPVDIDYSAVSNAGLWVMGRLQTKQDRERVLDGLAGAAGELDRSTLSGWLEALPSRTFLVKDVKEREPFLVKSRWAISYLRGPMTRRELERLDQSEPVPAVPAAAATPARAVAAATPDDGLLDTAPPPPVGEARFLDPAVAFSARLAPCFDAFEEAAREDRAIVWRAGIYARLHLTFDERDFVLERDEHRLFFPVDDVRVEAGFEPAFEPGDLLPSSPGGRFHPIPAAIDEKRELAELEKRVKEEVYRSETEVLLRHAALKLDSRAGEDREAFRARVEAAIEDRIDAEVAKLKDRTDKAVARLEDKQRKLERDIASGESDISGAQTAEVLNIAETAFAWFTGRRKSVSTAVTKRNQTRRLSDRVERSRAELTELERELYDLEVELETQVTAIRNEQLRAITDIEEIPVKLERADVRLDEFGIVWVPVTRGY